MHFFSRFSHFSRGIPEKAKNHFFPYSLAKTAKAAKNRLAPLVTRGPTSAGIK